MICCSYPFSINSVVYYSTKGTTLITINFFLLLYTMIVFSIRLRNPPLIVKLIRKRRKFLSFLSFPHRKLDERSIKSKFFIDKIIKIINCCSILFQLKPCKTVNKNNTKTISPAASTSPMTKTLIVG